MPERSGLLIDVNQAIANLLLDLAEVHKPSARFWGYKRAANAIRQFPCSLTDLSEQEILRIPTVGPATYRVVREYFDTGRSPGVERAIEESDRKKVVEQRRALRSNFLSNAMVQRILREPRAGAVALGEYGGDFQMHSIGSDGSDTLEDLAEACIKRDYRCACITDHSYGLPIAHGMTMAAMRQQRLEIERLNAQYGGRFTLFRGVEANLLADGRLDMQTEEIRELELVVASPHSALRKTDDQTERMLTAVSTPGVHILGHPRGRIFNSRAGIVADWTTVFRRASETGVAIEIDGDTSRQDVDFVLASEAKSAGCLFALDSDAHSGDQLFMAEYAIAHARLADIPAVRIINCWEPARILEWAARAWDR